MIAALFESIKKLLFPEPGPITFVIHLTRYYRGQASPETCYSRAKTREKAEAEARNLVRTGELIFDRVTYLVEEVEAGFEPTSA
jgi:hypothetical protein